MVPENSLLLADLETVESMAESILDAVATMRAAIETAAPPAGFAGSAGAGGS